MICIDASVFVAAARAAEEQHADSMAFLREVQAQGEEVYCPTLVLPECAAAIARRTDDPDLARQLVLLIEQYPRLQLVALALPLAQRAVQVAAMHQLRGADAVYVAVAGAVGARLITWEVEMLNRGAAGVSTATPTMWLEESAAGP